jgi:hypothetical protein
VSCKHGGAVRNHHHKLRGKLVKVETETTVANDWLCIFHRNIPLCRPTSAFCTDSLVRTYSYVRTRVKESGIAIFLRLWAYQYFNIAILSCESMYRLCNGYTRPLLGV